jgi:glycerol-3-phosphate acyltransferase PlsY
MLLLVVYFAVAYLLGAMPFGLVAGGVAKIDIRRVGSGNIGFTNVMRVCGWRYGIPVLILDAAKGFFAVFLARFFIAPAAPDFVWQEVLGGIMSIVGHSFPLWLKFHGGKGVATGAGVAAILIPVPLLAALLTWVIVVATTRYVSLASLSAAVACVSMQIYLTWSDIFAPLAQPNLLLTLLIALMVFVRHRENIKRLRAGTEPKFYWGEKK